ncbi:peptidoglycan DD-metalloendopeptidase family protein [Salinibacillus xinjiangensis]|uniref:Peptidoglycan DD-metalloendopeptidase family protein n=1 Tax=Salinibacillus xinjiangensis TaxID=1229268 RepID=A0A6G1X3Z2_9BACI|nr:peptidoglycan DD-metalloendopeptidase family protein [Salinibacillus xinjiangensis]
MPKVVLTTCLSIGITLGSSTVQAENNDNELPKVFHVYIDGELIGSVGSKDVVKSFIEEKVSEEEKTREDDLQLTVSQDIKYVPEVTFNPSYNNHQVINQLKEQISYSVQAIKMEIDGELVGYFNDKESAKEVLNTYMEKYLPEDVVEKFNDPDYEPKKDIKLSVGQSTYLDVSFDEKVSLEEEKINPNELLTHDQALQLLERGTVADKIHKVQAGEALSTIAGKYDLSVPELLSLNPEMSEDSVIQIGQEVNVTGLEPFLDVVATEEKIVDETIDYKTEYKETDELYKGQTQVKQYGQEGMKRVHYRLTKKNGQVEKREVLESETIKEPVNKIILEGTKVIPSRGTGSFRWPAAGGFITSGLGQRWGSFHKGIDISGVSNRSIYAADNGVVESAGWNSGYGKQVVINHRNGYRTSYSHLSSINVSPGQTVKKGQTIGVMGSTGNSTGVHLHFELYKNGALQNPASYF